MSDYRSQPPSHGIQGPIHLGDVEEILGSAQIREQHRALILRLLWRKRESSRADLSRATGLSRSTVSAIVAELIDAGLIFETREGISRGGRKPIVLAFADDANTLVGVDVGATHVSVVATDLRGRIKGFGSRPCKARTQPESALEVAKVLIGETLTQANIPRRHLLGIGIGLPSPVHPDRPGEVLPLILPKWKDFNMLEALGQSYHVPLFADNDANLGALAEAWWGEGRKAHSLAFIKVAYGIGSGLVIDGRIHRGRDGTAGEIGHISLDPNGPACICGLHGCINTMIGTQQLLDRAKARASAFPDSTLATRKRPTLEQLVLASQQADPLAQDILGYVGDLLGTAIANLLNLVAPEVIILGGDLTRAGTALLEAVESTVRHKSLIRGAALAEIRLSQLGNESVALGAATLVLEAALEDPRMFVSASGAVA